VMIAAARRYVTLLCTEPVRDKYLELCKKRYKPPKFIAALDTSTRSTESNRIRKLQEVVAKLWFLGRIIGLNPSRTNQALLDSQAGQVAHEHGMDVDELCWIRFSNPPYFYRSIKAGDWIIEADETKRVGPPRQVIKKSAWKSSRGTKYSMLWLESSEVDGTIAWTKFCALARRLCPILDQRHARAKPIADNRQADEILRLWMPSGAISKRTKT
jgi:hypothetical protein